MKNEAGTSSQHLYGVEHPTPCTQREWKEAKHALHSPSPAGACRPCLKCCWMKPCLRVRSEPEQVDYTVKASAYPAGNTDLAANKSCFCHESQPSTKDTLRAYEKASPFTAALARAGEFSIIC